LGYEEEKDEPDFAKIRQRHSERKAEEMKTRKGWEERILEKKANAVVQEKILADKSKIGGFTYDYEGSFYGISPGKISDAIPILK
jgi:hypothetical protein